MSEALARQQKAGLPAIPQDLADLFGNDANAGMEGMSADDFALPFLRIVQSLSPERKRQDAKYIDGAEEGVIFNTVTRQLYGNAITVIPVYYDTAVLEWRPRAAGGGFVARYDTREDALASAEEGNDLQDISNVYVLVNNSGDWDHAVLTFKKGARGTAKAWNSKMKMTKLPRSDGSKFTPPIFAKQYSITTVERSNEKGSWFVFKVDLEGGQFVQDLETYALAKTFHESLLKGVVGADFRKDVDEPPAGASDVEDGEPKM